VHRYLKIILPISQGLDVLEINCGTGHDALLFASQGHRVLATDISSEMIAIAKTKYRIKQDQLKFKQLDINALNDTHFDTSFDLIFSNFGGLNCLSPEQLENFFISAKKKLKPNGKIIGVIMPKLCLMEIAYFILKGDFKKAFRRNTNDSVIANVDGTQVNTWYYNPKNIKMISKQGFSIQKIKPVGFCIPPSYLEPFFKNKLRLLKTMQQFDSFIPFSCISKYSDHYLISLSKT
jgi:ubiquinone/menaquinone biosynthesis C-methylase UbiE